MKIPYFIIIFVACLQAKAEAEAKAQEESLKKEIADQIQTVMREIESLDLEGEATAEKEVIDGGKEEAVIEAIGQENNHMKHKR